MLEERLAEVEEREAALERREQELQAAALAQATSNGPVWEMARTTRQN